MDFRYASKDQQAGRKMAKAGHALAEMQKSEKRLPAAGAVDGRRRSPAIASGVKGPEEGEDAGINRC